MDGNHGDGYRPASHCRPETGQQGDGRLRHGLPPDRAGRNPADHLRADPVRKRVGPLAAAGLPAALHPDHPALNQDGLVEKITRITPRNTYVCESRYIRSYK